MILFNQDHLLSLIVIVIAIHCQSLPFIVTRCHWFSRVVTRCDSLSLSVIRCHFLYFWLSLDVSLV